MEDKNIGLIVKISLGVISIVTIVILSMLTFGYSEDLKVEQAKVIELQAEAEFRANAVVNWNGYILPREATLSYSVIDNNLEEPFIWAEVRKGIEVIQVEIHPVGGFTLGETFLSFIILFEFFTDPEDKNIFMEGHLDMVNYIDTFGGMDE